MRFVLLLLFGLNAHAAAKKDLFCVKDMRPVGGDYQSFSVERNSKGKFDVRYTFLPNQKGFAGLNGFTVPVNNERVGTDLDCVASELDERIRQCYSVAFSDTYSARLETQLVNRSDLRELYGTTTHVMISSIDLSFFSGTFAQKQVSFDPSMCTLK